MNGVIFENIDTGESVLISPENEGGTEYMPKLSALMNSSNIGVNSDRGQDFGWRLQPEQQALLEEWESDGTMIEKVSAWAHIPSDALDHGNFLAYLVYYKQIGNSPVKRAMVARREMQLSYEERVAQLRSQASNPEPLAPFAERYGLKAKDEGLNGFLNGQEDEISENIVENHDGVLTAPDTDAHIEIDIDAVEDEAPSVPTPKAPAKRSTKK
jgi:hypothetical protein